MFFTYLPGLWSIAHGIVMTNTIESVPLLTHVDLPPRPLATRGQAGACSARTVEIFVETLADFNEIRSRTFTRFLQHTEKQINVLSFLDGK